MSPLLLLSLFAAPAAAEPCESPANIVDDVVSIMTDVVGSLEADARLEDARAFLEGGDTSSAKSEAHALAEALRAQLADGAIDADQAESLIGELGRIWTRADQLADAWDFLQSGDFDSAKAEAHALAGDLRAEAPEMVEIIDQLGRLWQLADRLQDAEAALNSRDWGAAKEQAHEAAELARDFLAAGELSEGDAQAAVDVAQQQWGEADEGESRSTTHLPFDPSYPITSEYGYRIHPIHGTRKLHTGTDVGIPYGGEVYAPGSGSIEYAGWAGGYGNHVVVRLDDGTEVTYSHLADMNGMYVGRRVEPGEVVGHVNSTGSSTGDHLHLEVIDTSGNYINPRDYFNF